ncbi:MAG: septal ring lytic transglycosylase RlpA family protein [Chitinophagaceae bacterium]|nr:septal ring lytic transglycosylase RlpA family protein [Chitinophagaceae bacterium]
MKGIRKLLLGFLLCNCAFSTNAQKLYSHTGRASFYASKFDGRKTANGEIFSNKKLTAAHLTLPFGTLLRVTNLKNNKSVVVRVNDRGPYVKSRIIDLSRAAADSLDFIHSGWTMVKVEEIKPEPILALNNLPVPPLSDPYQMQFPKDWIGQWDGILKVYSERGLEQNVPMKLSIQPTSTADRYAWTIVYDTIPRNYELVVRDSSKGYYSLDERNGIDIMSGLFGNHFTSRFSVTGNLLDCDYELLNYEEMKFTISTGRSAVQWTTGNIIHPSDTIPEIGVYNITNMQVATLQRIKN